MNSLGVWQMMKKETRVPQTRARWKSLARLGKVGGWLLFCLGGEGWNKSSKLIYSLTPCTLIQTLVSYVTSPRKHAT